MRCVSNGVPLLVGQAKDVDQLRVVASDGRPVPAQFRVLARWWRADNSIRWVLVSFIRQDKDGANPLYRLVGGKAAVGPKTTLNVTEDDDAIRVDTGAAQFEISKKLFNIFDKVVVDGQTVVCPDAKLGSVVTDPEGRKYYSAPGTQTVRVLESATRGHAGGGGPDQGPGESAAR